MKNLIPAIIQDSQNGDVLMLGYMNQQAFQKTLKTKKVWFYSRSKKRLWMKGETSGNVLKFEDAKFDCDRDAILIKARPMGPTCHTGKKSCFGDSKANNALSELFNIIVNRKMEMPKNSYTSSLFRAGTKKILAKIKEESAEVIQAAQKETKKRLIEESVDVLYHLFVLLAQKKIALSDIEGEIKKRMR
ncbi:MAG: bifunctional phosphoribosyl-AMP cyclohydrolase/phosphoribosyl-ATP diphosphatase HisIE [Patescibacteria group bacterium]